MNVRYRVELSQAERDELMAMLSGGKHAARERIANHPIVSDPTESRSGLAVERVFQQPARLCQK